MKAQHSSIAAWKTLVVAVAVLALGSLAGSALAAAAPDQITVHNQDLSTGVIVIDSVTAGQDGWVVVYKNPNFTTGEIVGYAPVHQGVNKDVKVTINTTKVGDLPSLWARLHVDNDVKGLFEWGLRDLPYNDAPVQVNGHDVVAEFGTWGNQGTPSAAPAMPVVAPAPSKPVAVPAPVSAKPTTAANAIDVTTQALNSGVMHVNSVKTGQDGWVVVYKSPNFTPGDIVGYAPVHQGVNTNVPVTIDTRRVEDLPGLWIQLQADNGVPGLFEWGLRNLPYNDQPVIENGHPVMTGFAITDVP